MRKKKLKYIAMMLSLCMMSSSQAFATSLSIDEAISLAISQNNSIRIAQTEEQSARANLKSAKGATGFSVSLGSSLSANDGADSQFSRGNSNSISASIPIYTGRKNELTIDNRQVDLVKAQLNIEREKEIVKYNTIKAYFDILQAQENINIDQESVDNYQKHLTDTNNLYSAGSIPRSDVLRSEVALSDAKQSLISAENTLQINLSSFRNIIKVNKDESINLTDRFTYKPFKMGLEECLDYAFAMRKDMESAKLDLDIAKNDIEIAKAGYLPTVNFSISTSWDRQPLPSNNDYDYGANVSANWNVFDNNVTKANIEAAQANYDKVSYTLSDTADDIDLEVRQAYLNMREAEKRFNSTQLAIKKAEEDYFIASEKYRVGAGVILDVIDAEYALSQARLNYANAQYDYARYRANLEYAMGVPEGESVDG